MAVTYVPRSRVRAFEEKYGKAEHKSEHREYIALHYDKIPFGVVKTMGGGWYTWKGRTQGREAAFAEAGRHF